MRGKRGLVRNYKGKEADEQKEDVVPVDIYEIKKMWCTMEEDHYKH